MKMSPESAATMPSPAATSVADYGSAMSSPAASSVCGGQLSCEHCGKVLSTSRLLREHVAQHKWGPHEVIHRTDGRTVFRCLFEGCGKLVKDRKVLRKHLLTHKPREFICSVPGCGKRFYERAKLKRHNLVHTGEKDFACTFPGCDKRFAYKANLKTHIRTHTGHRPYACTFPGCNKSFAQASNRNSHMLTHSHAKTKRKLSETNEGSSPSSTSNNLLSMLSSNSENLKSFNLKCKTEISSPVVAPQGNTVLATAQARLQPPSKARKLHEMSSPQADMNSAPSSPESERPGMLESLSSCSSSSPLFSSHNMAPRMSPLQPGSLPASLCQSETVRSLLSLSESNAPPFALAQSTAPHAKVKPPSSLDKMADLAQLTAHHNNSKLAASRGFEGTQMQAQQYPKKMPLGIQQQQQPKISIPSTLPRVPASSLPSASPTPISPSFFEDFMTQLKMSPKQSPQSASALASLLSPSPTEHESGSFSPLVFPSSSVQGLFASSTAANNQNGFNFNSISMESPLMQRLLQPNSPFFFSRPSCSSN